MKKTAITLVGAGLMALGGAAQAELTYLGEQEVGGTGLGSVNTILTLQAAGSGITESGGIGVGSDNMPMITGDAKTGASQSQLLTFGGLGLDMVSDLRLVFNAVEPGNGGNGLTIDNLVLSFYDASGASLFNSGAFTPVTLPSTNTGTGNSGFTFALDSTQAAAAQAALGASFADVRIGLKATLLDVSGGPETFYVANAAAPVPEPASLALMAAGLAGIGAWRRRQRAAA